MENEIKSREKPEYFVVTKSGVAGRFSKKSELEDWLGRMSEVDLLMAVVVRGRMLPIKRERKIKL
jgi:hypothetical protein